MHGYCQCQQVNEVTAMLVIPVEVTKVDAHNNVIERKPAKLDMAAPVGELVPVVALTDATVNVRAAQLAYKRLEWTTRSDVVRVIVRDAKTKLTLAEAVRA